LEAGDDILASLYALRGNDVAALKAGCHLECGLQHVIAGQSVDLHAGDDPARGDSAFPRGHITHGALLIHLEYANMGNQLRF
jgi:hypothetical protein